MNAAALLASKAYGGVAQAATNLGATGPQVAGKPDDFSSLVSQQLSNTMSATRGAEVQAANVATGHAELVDAVTAISAAEVQMETMIAFRDQAIQAYQEITRMPI